MKLLRFNESDSYLNAKEIANNIKEICKDLDDEDIQFHVMPWNDIQIKMLGLYLKGIVKNRMNEVKFEVKIFLGHSARLNKPYEISISEQNIILNTLRHLENYIKTEGLSFKYEVTAPNKKEYGRTETTTITDIDNIFKERPEIIKIIFDK